MCGTGRLRRDSSSSDMHPEALAQVLQRSVDATHFALKLRQAFAYAAEAISRLPSCASTRRITVFAISPFTSLRSLAMVSPFLSWVTWFSMRIISSTRQPKVATAVVVRTTAPTTLNGCYHSIPFLPLASSELYGPAERLLPSRAGIRPSPSTSARLRRQYRKKCGARLNGGMGLIHVSRPRHIRVAGGRLRLSPQMNAWKSGSRRTVSG